MLVDNVKKTFVCSISTIKNFTLTVENKFLKIKGNCFSNAEIFCILRHVHFHFFTYSEKVINGITTGKNYCRLRLYINLLFTKIFCRDSLQPNKRMKI